MVRDVVLVSFGTSHECIFYGRNEFLWALIILVICINTSLSHNEVSLFPNTPLLFPSDFSIFFKDKAIEDSANLTSSLHLSYFDNVSSNTSFISLNDNDLIDVVFAFEDAS